MDGEIGPAFLGTQMGRLRPREGARLARSTQQGRRRAGLPPSGVMWLALAACQLRRDSSPFLLPAFVESPDRLEKIIT